MRKEVVAPILIVLGLVVVGAFIYSLQGNGSKGGSCGTVDVEAISCEISGNNVVVEVRRNSGRGNLNAIGFEFVAGKKTRKLVSDVSDSGGLPSEGETRTFSFTDVDAKRADLVGVSAVVSSNKKKVCAPKNQPIVCNIKGGSSGNSCGNNILEAGEQCDDGNLVNGDGCDNSCEIETNSLSCGDYNIIQLLDFDESTCTRTRNGLVPAGVNHLPSLGVRLVGGDANAKNKAGASMGRDIIQWYSMYDSSGNLDFTNIDDAINEYKQIGMKVIVTLRSNDPERSEVSFDKTGRTLFQPDSYPKDEAVWVNYLQRMVNRYYTGDGSGHEGAVAGFQIGNEWNHQFEVNEAYGRYTKDERGKAILDLMDLSYTTIKDIDPSIPVIGFAVSITPKFALGAGYNEKGWLYDNNYYTFGKHPADAVTIIHQSDVDASLVSDLNSLIVDGSPFYDYFDAHIYFQTPDDTRYVANWIRDTWKKAGVTPKGLISTEFANPTYNSSYDLNSYLIKAGQAVAFHAGFDAIVWANWNPSQGSPNLLQGSLKKGWGTNWNGGDYLIEQINAYKELSDNSSDFISVSKKDKTFEFNLGTGEGDITLGFDKVYPSYYQCSDGLDNDDDGLKDSEDPDCYNFYNLDDPLGCAGVEEQDLVKCVDPSGFSETNWIFTWAK